MKRMDAPQTTDPLDWLDAAEPQAPFLVGSLSYAQLLDATARMAGGLVSRGVLPGDRVATQVEKSPEALILYLACLWIGAVYMPLNTGYTQAEIDYFVEDAEPKLFVTDAVLATLDDEPVARRAADPEAIAAMLYTSGTTGKPKGAMIPRRALASNGAALAALWRFTADDVLLHALPVYHVHGLFVATNTVLAAGASMRLLPKFDIETVLGIMPVCSVMMGVPTFYTRLLSQPERLADAARGMRLFVSGSAPLLADTHAAFETVTGHVILERYGMTETQINTSHPYDGPRLAGTVGPPLPGVEVRITDAVDGIGSIEVRGSNLFTGYWRNAEKTREDMRAGGWFATGDLGRIEEHGHVQIIGRGKDLIISGGLNIYPKEVESAIDALPGVTESAVIGVPHPDFGEAVVAVIVGNVTCDTIQAALAENLANFKRPKAIEFLPDLPRNAMGKVQKSLLRDRFAALFGD
jgi:malonyl-CoA/methylmalonyl-CoA synthetase